MKRQILQDIINNFNEEKFIRFFREANDKFRHPNESLRHEDDNFGQGTKLEEIDFEDGNLIVCSLPVKKPLTERAGKKVQYELGKKILKETQTDAGIFIFYDKNGNFRFSLIYANYLGKRRDWSAFRRFTYFVSKDLTNKTFLQRISEGNFSSLEKIKEIFSVEKVTKEFYQDIAYWYFWAVKNSRFPKDAEVEDNGRNVAIIRLITRMIFIWFMREKGLMPKELFEKENINGILKNIDSDDSTYYRAILQNLFFATLNTKKGERQFRSEIRGYKGYNPDFSNQYVYRYHDLFTNSEKMEEYFGNIPFLNGGLFDCLDDGTNDIYIDGFTERKQEYQPSVPNFLFFSDEQNIDLNSDYGTKNKNYKVQGLLNILSSFNFTIDENSPDDADIALDPELLGRVFENLLASFNPETSTTARKATGSYYTPREIVDYMVVESLKAYFKTHLSEIDNIDGKLDTLFSKEKEENPFNKSESKELAELIESVRIVDPAVGSGAFPMGALNKMVFILGKIDPDNELWKQAQLAAANKIPDLQVSKIAKQQIEEFFKDKNADYGRKLYLIQKCIYGVDIQQIAVEITKLRFFISLLVDEKIDETKENYGIEALPNLDFKIMQGNSLISEFLGIDFDKENGEEKEQTGLGFEEKADSIIKEFEQKKFDFQNESDRHKKNKLKQEVEDLMIKIFESKIKKQKAGYFRQIEDIERKYEILPNKKTREEQISKEKQKLSKKTGFDLENIEKQLREFTSKNKTRPFFLWKLYFAEVFEKGGFDIVIGNPPYGAKYSNQEKEFFKMRYKSTKTYEGQRGSTDTFVIFTEMGFNILIKNGSLNFILPISITSSDSMANIHELLEENCRIIKISSYAVRPQPIFENSVVNTAILFFIKTLARNEQIMTTKMYRKGKRFDLANLLKNLQFIDVKDYKLRGRYPKIGLPIEIDMLKKLLKLKIKIKDLLNDSGKPIYYRFAGGRYFKVVTNYSTGSSAERKICFDSEIADIVGAILSSNLFFWFYQIYSDNLNLKSYEVESFPIPLNKISKENIKKIKELYVTYLKSVEENARIRTTRNYANIDSFKEYKISKSKKYIDGIDDYIAPLYGLSQEELRFVKNYELEFRLLGNED
ncbi:Eco57I restriction-modification methylase domain-containing protein [bacterium]|nr:Eco57I restriction-modification methylase domain-containing protein [bacterium]